jgi:hypothetical protein
MKDHRHEAALPSLRRGGCPLLGLVAPPDRIGGSSGRPPPWRRRTPPTFRRPTALGVEPGPTTEETDTTLAGTRFKKRIRRGA